MRVSDAMTTTRQEIRCVVRAQSGDAEALDALLSGIQEPLYRYLVRLVGDRHVAEDILQEVFVLIIRNLCWLRVPEVFRPWVYRIASRQAFQILRRERRLRQRSEDDTRLAQVADGEPEAVP